MENLEDTIVAISTGSSAGAISIVRMSGPNAINIADQIFESKSHKKPSEFNARYLELGKAKTKNFTEQAMCVVFFAPNSYTGQNLVEIQCHGGLKIAQGIVTECISRGARVATNGEFTKRAFVNGKISLASAEGIADMINAETDAQIRAGYNLLNGKLSTFASDAQAELTDLLSEIEVSFDYPEEQIEYITKKNVETRLQKLAESMQKVLDTAGTGQIISNGINVLIVGKPNVGKSSLLNAMIDRERALVTDVPGTTRDTIEDTLSINGIKVNIIDTAGIHQTTDLVEKLGVEKAKSLIDKADIVLFVTDGSAEIDAEDNAVLDLINNKTYIHVENKIDKKKNKNNSAKNSTNDKKIIAVSSVTGEGIENLKQEIFNKLNLPNMVESGIILTNERHKQAMQSAYENINKALYSISTATLDLVSIDLKLAYSALGEITGNTTGEDIIDAIFSKFCLGK